MSSVDCPLCFSKITVPYYSSKREFFRCSSCDLTFVNPLNLLSKFEEEQRYLKHDNGYLSDGYKSFLYNVIDSIKSYISVDKIGLDYGCGPYPMMSKLLSSEAYTVDSYDPYFCDIFPLKKYDFLILCEVVEHFNVPKEDFLKVKSLLKEDAYLFIQTSILDESINFANWYYKNDLTHVSFYSPKTIEYILSTFSFSLEKMDKNLVVLKNKL